MTGAISPSIRQKSAELIAIEKELLEVQARIDADRKRRDAEIKAAIEQARRDAEAIKRLKGEKKAATTPNTPNPNLKPLPTPQISLTPPSVTNTLLGPARGGKELPESALFLLRDLWSHLGYTGDAFIEMQMEIGRELDRADFARFEREMLCNECIGARAEIQMLKEERAQLTKRLELNRETISRITETEERTYNTLMAERATAENVIRVMESDMRELKAQRDIASSKLEEASNHLERVEKARLAAVLYAKGAEDRAAAANATAVAAVEVANRHVHSPPHHSPAHPPPPVSSYWAAADDEAIKIKLKERILAVEEEKLASELAKVKDQREKLKSTTSPRAGDNATARPKETGSNNNNNNNPKGNIQESSENGKNNKNKSNNNKGDQKQQQQHNNNKSNNNNHDQSSHNNKQQQHAHHTPKQSNDENHKTRKSYIMDLF